MKLVIQIPCYNEEDSLPATLQALPRQIEGITQIEVLVVDDGSEDGTAEAAKANGADHLVRLPKNQGLARAFTAGLDACLQLEADIIVNTDADNQYHARDIAKLVQPIIEGRAEMVVGARPIRHMENFSAVKKLLQKTGSWVVRQASRTDVPDAPSGFRALSRDAALRMNIFNQYTYTLESIIQAGQKNMAVISVPVRVNKEMRPSRLIKSIPGYLRQSIMTIVRISVVYKPFAFFFTLGLAVFSAGFLLGIRFLYYFFTAGGQGHVQSLILAAVLLTMGFQTLIAAFLADLLAVNRKLLEDIQYRLRRENNGRLG